MQDNRSRFINLSEETVAKIRQYLDRHPIELLRIPGVRKIVAADRYDTLKDNALSVLDESQLGKNRRGTSEHNLANLDSLVDYDRGSDLVAPLVNIPFVQTSIADLRVLSIGPRTEMELLALLGVGVRPDNIEAIDLISYSPFVTQGDMHAIPFDDESFDIILAGWVLAYSRDVDAAVEEMVRVAKHGSVLAIGCDRNDELVQVWNPEMTVKSQSLKHEQTKDFLCPRDIEKLFGDRIGSVFHRQNSTPPYDDISRRILTVFSLEKENDSLHSIRDQLRQEMAATTRMRTLVLNNTGLSDEQREKVLRLVEAHANYCCTGTTEAEAFLLLRELHGESRGTFDRLFHNFIASQFPPIFYNGRDEFDLLGSVLTKKDIESIVKEVSDYGFSKLPWRVPDGLIEDLSSYIDTLPCTNRRGKDFQTIEMADGVSSRLNYSADDLLRRQSVQSIVCNDGLVAIAEAYMNCQVVLDIVTAFVSLPVNSDDLQELSANAQLWHFDKDRLKFLKVFVFLSDVDEESGPFAYVRGSHKKKPDSMWHAVRFTDEDVLEHFSSNEIETLTGPAGTIVIADTMGIHKGTPVQANLRKMFQVQFSGSLFGKPLERHKKDLCERIESWPVPEDCDRLFQHFPV